MPFPVRPWLLINVEVKQTKQTKMSASHNMISTSSPQVEIDTSPNAGSFGFGGKAPQPSLAMPCLYACEKSMGLAENVCFATVVLGSDMYQAPPKSATLPKVSLDGVIVITVAAVV